MRLTKTYTHVGQHILEDLPVIYRQICRDRGWSDDVSLYIEESDFSLQMRSFELACKSLVTEWVETRAHRLCGVLEPHLWPGVTYDLYQATLDEPKGIRGPLREMFNDPHAGLTDFGSHVRQENGVKFMAEMLRSSITDSAYINCPALHMFDHLREKKAPWGMLCVKKIDDNKGWILWMIGASGLACVQTNADGDTYVAGFTYGDPEEAAGGRKCSLEDLCGGGG